ncbi:hypothetical protein QBC37DRAFT_318474 [Rhypophila decipiens]|uniref:Uncharacterized protein n=1 Tax=Rhypophila decipiens TaxID=261697 RepID=A0AAN7B495_9PEZI|nr:hypothetical protein QBC37DRAFT_318474 [Rhypophila decipiens]
MAVKSKNSLSQALDHGHQRSLSTQRIKGSQGEKNFYQTTLVPPSSQSHFAKFKSFTPKNDAGFEHEFARLASSQNWVPGSQQFKKERTIAMRQEFICHFFSSQPTQPTKTEEPANPTPEQELRGFQDLCSEVGLPRAATIPECKRALKTKLVNIVDLIDTRRTGKKVKIWTDFEAFKDYTLQPEHKIDREEAKAGPGYLAALLQNLGPPNKKIIGGNRSRSGGGNKTAGGFKHGKTRSGRVEKGH